MKFWIDEEKEEKETAWDMEGPVGAGRRWQSRGTASTKKTEGKEQQMKQLKGKPGETKGRQKPSWIEVGKNL